MPKETSYDRFLQNINVVKPRVQRPPKESKRREPQPAVTLFENPKELLTVKQVADALGVSIQRVYLWIHGGELRAVRFPGNPARNKSRIRILAADANTILRPAVPDAGQVPHY